MVADSQLTALEKQKLCQIKEKAPQTTQADLIKHAKEHFKKNPSQTSMVRMLKKKNEYLALQNASSKGHRIRKSTFPQIEKALDIWFEQMVNKGADLTDKALRKKALRLASKENIPRDKFSASVGWLTKFKKRHGIRIFKQHGEAQEANQEGIELSRTELPKYIEAKGFQAKDIYNMDETGLLYRTRPNRSLAKSAITGGKVSKERMTVCLTTNCDGSDKLRPLIIWKYKKPRCFGRTFDPQNHVDFFNNQKAWMTSEIFEKWLTKINRRMKREGRRILLIMDNATSHKVSAKAGNVGESFGFDTIELSNVTVIFIPSRVTSVVQPLDAGIIASFKVCYRGLLLDWLLNELEMAGDTQDVSELKPNVKQGIMWACEAWDSVTPTTIMNCWRKAGICPSSFFSSTPRQEQDSPDSDLRDLNEAINRLEQDSEEIITAEDYVQLSEEDDIEEELTDAELLAMARDSDDDEMEEEDDKDPNDQPPERVSLEDARNCAKILEAFVLNEPGTFDPKTQDSFCRLRSKLNRIIIARHSAV